MNHLTIAKAWIEKRLSLTEVELVDHQRLLKPLLKDTNAFQIQNTENGEQDANANPIDSSEEEQNRSIEQPDEPSSRVSDCSISLAESYSYSFDSLSSTDFDRAYRSLIESNAQPVQSTPPPQNQNNDHVRSTHIFSTRKMISLAISTLSFIGDTFSFAATPMKPFLPDLVYPQVVTYMTQFQADILQNDSDRLSLFHMITRLTVYGPWLLSNQSMEPVYSAFAELSSLTKCMVYVDKKDKALVLEEMSFGFAGCSWLLPYELGAAQCIQDSFRKDVISQFSFIGSQTGVVPALALALNLDPETLMNDFTVAAVNQSGTFFKGATSQLSCILEPILEKHVPKDISKLGTRLSIVCSEFPSGKEHRVNQFKNRKDLIQYALASCSLPIIGTHSLQLENGVVLVSNQFSNHQSAPVINNLTMTVQPYHGLANIRPETQLYQSHLLWKCSHQQGTYYHMFEDGYNHSKEFFKKSKKNWILSHHFFSKLFPFGSERYGSLDPQKDTPTLKIPLSQIITNFIYDYLG